MKPKSIGSLILAAIFSTFSQAQEAAKPASPEKPAAPAPAEAPAAPALDFGDHSSQTLTTKAWAAFEAKKHAEVDGYTAKCIELYEKTALEMQATLTGPAPAGKEHDYWALNDVGVCYFIRAQSKEARKETSGALTDYKMVAEKLSHAQCWDTKGWFWKPADAAAARIKALEFDALK